MEDNRYIKPSIEVIQVELEGTMAQSPKYNDDLENARGIDGPANARRRGLWEE